MYQDLLDKALMQQEASLSATPQQEPRKLVSKPSEAKQEPKEKEPVQEKKQKKEKRPVPDPEFMFQAIGVIVGDVEFDGMKASITIKDKTYRLLCPSGKEKIYLALKSEVTHSGNKKQRVAVYPRIKHLPAKDAAPLWSWELIGFQGRQEPKGIFAELKDFEFKLHGLWQFIAVCRTPCISVYKNYDYERGKFMKESEAADKVKLAKALHLPTLWRDAPVRPFKFNPKAAKKKKAQDKDKDEKKEFARFVQVKAKFMPQRECFGFICELSPAEEKAPRHLRVSKKDRAAAQASKAA